MKSILERKISIEESKAFLETFSIKQSDKGSLNGLTFAVKDLIDIGGYKTSCGNPSWLKTHPVAASNAVCVDQLLNEGAECIGKTISDELAFSLEGENFFYGTPLNPRAPDRIPGGSSSGSASAVSCGLVDFAIGTDTGGSVRVPASNCGIFGMRPSHGFISLAGVNPLAPSFDTVGVLARDSSILSKVAEVLIGFEINPKFDVGTIYLIREALDLVDEEVREAIQKPINHLRNLFPDRLREFSIREIDGEMNEKGLKNWYETHYTIQWADIWSSLGSWVEEAKPEFGPRIKKNFDIVKDLDRSKLEVSIRKRFHYFRRLKEFLKPNDLLCIPTAPAVAPLKGSLGIDRTKSDYHLRTLSLTSTSGIGRLPQVSLPMAHVKGVPVGISLLGAYGEDSFLLSVVNKIASEEK